VADVIQAAAAEVEDYVRVTVVTDASDAVAGISVSDVIHLLAELIENATQFSPPDTRVEVRGMVVGRGFAVEIEDRGLGMEPLMLAQVNQRLAEPPEFDLAGTDQLGLFVAGRLAQQHGIRIALRPSAYGGTTAVVVLPNDIIVSPNQPGTGTGPSLAVQPATASVDGTYREVGPVGRRSAGALLAPGGRHRGPSRTPAQGSLPDFPEPPPQPGPTPAPRGTAAEAPVREIALPAAPTRQEEAADSSVGTHKGMPRRIRQASMAPQLRRQDGNGQADAAPRAAASPAASPEQLGSRLSSLQAGWLRGRLDDLKLPEPDLPGGPTHNPGSGAGQL
jgi:anti-sigma regulatory factor (Ser/Thr protein kinase)